MPTLGLKRSPFSEKPHLEGAVDTPELMNPN